MKKASGRNEDAMIWVGTGHEGAASLWTYIHPTETMHIHQYMYECPVDEEHVKVWLINLRNFMPDKKHDQTVMARNEYVVLQDRDVLEQLHPVETPPTNDKEMFMPADLCIGKYRERLKEWEARGWRIDSAAVRRAERRVAYAIPSPARRHSKGWVLDSIPLVQPPADAAALEPAAG